MHDYQEKRNSLQYCISESEDSLDILKRYVLFIIQILFGKIPCTKAFEALDQMKQFNSSEQKLARFTGEKNQLSISLLFHSFMRTRTF